MSDQRCTRIGSLAQTSALLTDRGILLSPVFESDRICVPLEKIAPVVLDALVSTEDRRFFYHRGIDLKGIIRATLVNLRASRIVQGGSTLTQQLARMAVLRRADRTLSRKLAESWVALILERELTKRQIMEAYLNAAYFGHGLYGIEQAALAFCGKPAALLNEEDAAYLIGLLKAPARYCRCCNPERATNRTRLVQRLSGFAARSEYPGVGPWKRRQTLAESLPLTAPYVLEYARRCINRELGSHYPFTRLKIYTTIDAHCQAVVENVCRTVRRRGYRGRLSCVIQDARSGAIRGLAGGSGFDQQQFNSATDGHLQPGSVLKPFILLAALEQGMPLDYQYESRPIAIRIDNGHVWTVRNAGNRYTGWTTVSDALVHSDNTVYAQMLSDIGVSRVTSMLSKAGIPLNRGTLALSTGAVNPGVSPLQVSTAYSVFSNGGVFLPTSMLSRALDERGILVWESAKSQTRLCSQSTADSVSSVLRRVNSEGTGLASMDGGIAAKTGTSLSGGWYASFDKVYRVLTWTETDFSFTDAHTFSGKAVSAKELAARVWELLRRPRLGFQDIFSSFAGVESMSVPDLIWVEDRFQEE